MQVPRLCSLAEEACASLHDTCYVITGKAINIRKSSELPGDRLEPLHVSRSSPGMQERSASRNNPTHIPGSKV